MRGGVCTYIKECLPERHLSDLCLKGFPIFELCINNKKGYKISLYSSPSQSANDFDLFDVNFEKLVVLYI